MDELDDIVKEFLVESFEGLDQLDRDLVALEEDPTDQDLLAAVFRCIHTIKGTCGFLAFGKLESVAHAGESVLCKLRDGKLSLTADLTSGLLTMVDSVREILRNIELSGGEGDGEYSDVVALMERLQVGESQPDVPPPPPPTEPDPGPTAPEGETADPTKGSAAAPASITAGKKTPRKRKSKRSADRSTPKVSPSADAEPEETSTPTEASEPSEPTDAAPAASGETRAAVSESTIRVQVGLLDTLMNLVGELVLARNQVLQSINGYGDSAMGAASQHLNLITTELQASVMKTRMQPIGTVWSKFPRVVRDLSHTFDKAVRIEMEGKSTEMDKTILEAIKDPLTHIVRNSVDHGIEGREIRAQRHKPPEGVIYLRAFHEGGQVNIEIADDGGGVDIDRVKDKAVERGLMSRAHADAMGDREAVNLVFARGFSTAETVSNVSGRGVGMDVVRTNIERIGGSVDVQSVRGEGTTVKVKIPLTLAIIPALIVNSGGERFAIPQVSLLELVRLGEREKHDRIENVHGAPVYRLRGRLLPLVFLRRELGLNGASDGRAAPDKVNIVVLHAEDRQFGLVVDGVSDTAEIVVKPLGNLLKGLTTFAGATIMGDGKVALILDVMGLAQRAKVITDERERIIAAKERIASQEEGKESILIIRGPDDGRMGIPLRMVDRLEEFPRGKVERAGRWDVVQYRGTILPLICANDVIPERRMVERNPPTSDPQIDPSLHVVVYSRDGRSVGLVVDQILDIVHESLASQRPPTRHGIIATVVIQDRVTELLDIEALIQRADLTQFAEAAIPASEGVAHG